MYFKIDKVLKSVSGILKILFFVLCGINKIYEKCIRFSACNHNLWRYEMHGLFIFKEIWLCFVRVHIRRTDKLAAEASFHSVAEYMTYVEDYFSALELRNPGVQRRVFLASDDPTALPEAKKKYYFDFLNKWLGM